MSKRTKIVLLIVAFVVLAGLAVAGVLLMQKERKDGTTFNAQVARIGGGGLCTMDEPTSYCTAYEVTFKAEDGQSASYMVEGFSGGDAAERERFQGITSAIRAAQENGSSVTVVVDKQNQLVSVE